MPQLPAIYSYDLAAVPYTPAIAERPVLCVLFVGEDGDVWSRLTPTPSELIDDRLAEGVLFVCRIEGARISGTKSSSRAISGLTVGVLDSV